MFRLIGKYQWSEKSFVETASTQVVKIGQYLIRKYAFMVVFEYHTLVGTFEKATIVGLWVKCIDSIYCSCRPRQRSGSTCTSIVLRLLSCLSNNPNTIGYF